MLIDLSIDKVLYYCLVTDYYRDIVSITYPILYKYIFRGIRMKNFISTLLFIATLFILADDASAENAHVKNASAENAHTIEYRYKSYQQPEKTKEGFYLTVKAGFGLFSADGLKAVNPSGGSVVSTSNDKIVIGGGLAAGYDFFYHDNTPVRVDLEVLMFAKTQRSYELPSASAATLYQTFNMNTLMANVYYDFHTTTNITPYFGVGLGIAFTDTWLETSQGSFSTSQVNFTNLAWSLGGGIGVILTETISLDFGYKFINLGEVETSTILDTTAGSTINGFKGHAKSLFINSFQAGIRCTF